MLIILINNYFIFKYFSYLLEKILQDSKNLLYNFDEKLISKRIREIRKSKNLKIEDLAKKIGITKAYVSQL